MPKSDLSDKGLKTAFESLGAVVVSADAYKNVMPENLTDLDFSVFDEVVFTSPSAVRNFKKRYGNRTGKNKSFLYWCGYFKGGKKMSVSGLSRLRRTGSVRDLVAQTRISPSDIILPYFVVEGQKYKRTDTVYAGRISFFD